MSKNVILILLSCLVLCIAVPEFGYMFMSVPSVIILSYNVSDLVLKMINQNQPKNLKKSKDFQYVALIGILSYFFVLRTYEDTIGGYNLFWKLALLSIGLNLLVLLVLNKYYNFNNDSKFYNLLSFSICCFLLVPNFGIFINKNVYNEPERRKTVIINYKDLKKSKHGYSYELFIKTKYDSNERLDITKEVFEAIKDDQIIVMTLRKGVLGYDYITKIDVK